MSNNLSKEIKILYGPSRAKEIEEQLRAIMNKWKDPIAVHGLKKEGPLAVSEKDSIVITYGDQFQQKGHTPLDLLGKFFLKEYKDIVSGIHILPFSPYSSDDGFSVIDYRKVNPEWGDWEELEKLSPSFRLMFDLVLNHCSAKSPWFQGFLKEESPYKNYFITVPDDTDVSEVVRPRALPLLTPFETPSGTKWVWTTFSADQVDLDFSNPEVLAEFVDIILMYAAKGAHIIRLDAIAYLWKELGSSCIHHEKTHSVVRLFRAIFDELAPWVLILTETNVPHTENISYFGSGLDEAHMVYQFSLPPLTLHAFITGNSTYLQKWASSLPQPDGNTTFFNFLASHDGVGVTPAKGLLNQEELQKLYNAVQERGGRISYKDTPQGPIPYELNISYRDGIAEKDLDSEKRSRKFLCSQAIMLSMAGVPGIYVHSLLGSGNYPKGVEDSGINRRINREKFQMDILEKELEIQGSLRNQIASGYKELLLVRRSQEAFHPKASQKILQTPSSLFALVRGEGESAILCVHNITGNFVNLSLSSEDLPGFQGNGYNLTTRKKQPLSRTKKGWEISLEPFEILWMRFSP